MRLSPKGSIGLHGTGPEATGTPGAGRITTRDACLAAIKKAPVKTGAEKALSLSSR
jgi:hypothetical protein